MKPLTKTRDAISRKRTREKGNRTEVKVQCVKCKHFHRRPCQQSGVVQPHAIGWCIYDMQRPGIKKNFRQPAAWDGEQGQFPYSEHPCKNWEER